MYLWTLEKEQGKLISAWKNNTNWNLIEKLTLNSFINPSDFRKKLARQAVTQSLNCRLSIVNSRFFSSAKPG